MHFWVWLVAAAATEVGWVAGIKTADDALDWAVTLVCIVASFGLALRAAQALPATTVYVIFVGLGASGTAALDALVFDSALHTGTLVFLALLLAGVVGLKLTSDAH